MCIFLSISMLCVCTCLLSFVFVCSFWPRNILFHVVCFSSFVSLYLVCLSVYLCINYVRFNLSIHYTCLSVCACFQWRGCLYISLCCLSPHIFHLTQLMFVCLLIRAYQLYVNLSIYYTCLSIRVSSGVPVYISVSLLGVCLYSSVNLIDLRL